MGCIELRYYQKDCVENAITYMRNGGSNGIAVLPTATGKSIIIAELIQRLFKHNSNHKIMMVTHVKELIEQNFQQLKKVWAEHDRPPAGMHSAGLERRDTSQPIIYGGIQSCFRNPKLFKRVTVVIIDECHRISDKKAGMYLQFIDGLRTINPDLRVIGFTATPYRMDMGHLLDGRLFDEVFYDISRAEDFVRLIEQNFLCDLKAVSPDNLLDISKVKIVAGEFSEKSLDENLNRDQISRKIVSETAIRVKDRNKGLAFCISISHAENMAQLFNSVGIPATTIHSKVPSLERDKRILGFRNGKFKIVTNVGVLTTGFDVPDVDFLLLSRPTRSTSLHVQILGRGMRVHDSKKDTLVLDYAGNILRLGLVNEPNLPLPTNANTESIVVCMSCKAIVRHGTMNCPECGVILKSPVSKRKRNVVPEKEVYIGEVVKRARYRVLGPINFSKNEFQGNRYRLDVEDVVTNSISTYTFTSKNLIDAGLQEADLEKGKIIEIKKSKTGKRGKRKVSKTSCKIGYISWRHNRAIAFTAKLVKSNPIPKKDQSVGEDPNLG